MHSSKQSDNELVDDILNEINQQQVDSGGEQHGVGLPEHPQLDAQTQHNMPPTTEEEVQDYQAAEIDTATVQTNGDVVSEGERLLRQEPAADQKPKGFFDSFDVFEFSKTLLLTMILFIVVTNVHTQSLACKIPYFCSTINGVMQLNFVGTSVLALLCGVALASAQAFA